MAGLVQGGHNVEVSTATVLIGPFVPVTSTHVPFFSWRKGFTLWLNGTSGGGAVHSSAPRLRPGCGAFLLLIGPP